MLYTIRIHVGALPEDPSILDMRCHTCEADTPLHAALLACAREAQLLHGVGAKPDAKSVFHAFVHYDELGRHANFAPRRVLYFAVVAETTLEAFETHIHATRDCEYPRVVPA